MSDDSRPPLIEPADLADQFLSRRTKDGTLALILDYGGTLTPIREDPDQADLDPGTVAILDALSAVPGMSVAVVSGRGLDDLDRHLGSGRTLFRFGDHGAEGTGPGMRLITTLDAHEELALLKSVAEDLGARKWPRGVWLERKGLCLTLHYEAANARDIKKVQQDLAQCIGEADRYKRLVRIPGKWVVEVRPAGLHKGLAVEFFRRRVPPPDCILYAGDEPTDEDGFRALGDADIGVLVSSESRESDAEVRLFDPAHVRDFLEALQQRLEAGSS